MSLPHAILTALLERSSSGRELTRRFDRSIGYFWSASHQQIYRELGRLEQAGLIRELTPDRPSRGQRREYEVLPAGRAELAAWVTRVEDPRPIRDPLILRLRAAAAVGEDASAGLFTELERHRRLHQAQLADYRLIEERDFTGPQVGPEADLLHHLVLRAGIELETFWTGWLTRALDELRHPALQDPVPLTPNTPTEAV
jgi:DNA-binding PadR family transcriptional regulator